jgi:hypothetical protein
MDQILYTSIDGGSWYSGYSIGKDLEIFEFMTESGKNYQVKITTQDTSGNESAGTTVEFTSVKPEELLPDTTAPLNPMKLVADTSKAKAQGIVVLNWKKALDVDNDIMDQVLYVKKGTGTWEEKQLLGKETETFEMEVEADENYEVKIVTVDASGNASQGAVTAFSTSMAQSGPGSVVALMIALAGGVLYLYRRNQVVY